MNTVKRKLPIVDAESGFFWSSGKAGELHIQRCGNCQRWQHPPLPCCPACGSQNMAPQRVSGNGTVATFTINHEPWHAGIDVPFCFAAIELDEQAELFVFSNVLGAVDSVRIGMRVSVCFEQHDDIFLPLFQPAVTAHG